MDDRDPTSIDSSRREFVKRAAYVAPAILTLNAVSATAKAGSAPPVNGGPTEPSQPAPRPWWWWLVWWLY